MSNQSAITSHPQTFVGATRFIVDACNYELNWQLERIVNCLQQLDNSDVWWRPTTRFSSPAKLNRIGDLVRHLNGNLSQWVFFGLGRDEKFRDRARDQEFQEAVTHSRDELITLIAGVVASALETIDNASEADWGRVHFVQSRWVSGFGAIQHTTMHLYGHTQEIICLTRQILGDKYKPHQDYAADGRLS